MSTLVIAGTALVAALGVASVAGAMFNRRSGVLREVSPDSPPDTSDLGLAQTGPTVVHFSAVWCGPCASVRRVVDQVCADLPDVSHVEIDIDANPAAAKRLSVLSLPTTLIFDAEGRQRYRSAGVPKAGDLRAVLQPLVA
ncbi:MULTISPECIES: thioredoxin family protein [unclassified Mycobacterium]|uniref:thioredoxin family protein n=3 Tax=Mycobacterium TaxID=1763 RepID=UPI0007FCB8B2|nr:MULTISPECIES: thioredoxin family protein [unclassified Mycobacterium]OBG57408.1 thiol reductase thioredoxin [Mycobacterium sp. E735]OBG62803.1 thiol reductase thioredoxin [Mycobacterium sp. E188]OBG81833.1 thiol reductase thioredoxin [Mycobacterium sp. E3305]OBH20062.1 thiol reductase thioredoxin [Mycobacterium sp. E1715]OBH44459.1 thiol reductase thioredoxin [Mycobacterium sp. E183]